MLRHDGPNHLVLWFAGSCAGPGWPAGPRCPRSSTSRASTRPGCRTYGRCTSCRRAMWSAQVARTPKATRRTSRSQPECSSTGPRSRRSCALYSPRFQAAIKAARCLHPPPFRLRPPPCRLHPPSCRRRRRCRRIDAGRRLVLHQNVVEMSRQQIVSGRIDDAGWHASDRCAANMDCPPM